MKITTRIGRLNDPRIKKIANGQYVAKGVQGMFTSWIAAFEALDDQNRRDYRELENFHK